MFRQDFREEKTSIKEFLGGPQILRQMQEDDMEDLLDEMFADFDEIMAF